jgi:tRNA-specific 2-thiouridylase
VDESGATLGSHGGQHRFTVGQRRGIGVAAPLPMYVTAKDPASNTITVGPREALATTTIPLEDVTLYRDASDVTHAKLRYRSDPIPCGLRSAVCELEVPVDGAAPGQTACLMHNETVIGCGTIAVPLRREVAHAG